MHCWKEGQWDMRSFKIRCLYLLISTLSGWNDTRGQEKEKKRIIACAHLVFKRKEPACGIFWSWTCSQLKRTRIFQLNTLLSWARKEFRDWRSPAAEAQAFGNVPLTCTAKHFSTVHKVWNAYLQALKDSSSFCCSTIARQKEKEFWTWNFHLQFTTVLLPPDFN